MFQQQNRLLSYSVVKRLFFVVAFVCSLHVASIQGAQAFIEYIPVKEIPSQYQPYVANLTGEPLGEEYVTLLTVEGIKKAKAVHVFAEVNGEPKKLLTMDNKEADHTLHNLIGINGFLPGQKISLVIKDHKNKQIAKVEAVMRRIVAKSLVDGAEIEAIAIGPGACAGFEIQLRGFKKNEKLHIQSKSYDETLESEINDVAVFCVTPNVIGKSGGVAEIVLKRQSGEMMKIGLPWGYEQIRYITYVDEKGKIKKIIDDPSFKQLKPEVAKYFFDNH